MSLKNRRRLRKQQERSLEQSMRDIGDGEPTSNTVKLSEKISTREDKNERGYYEVHLNTLQYNASLKRIQETLKSK